MLILWKLLESRCGCSRPATAGWFLLLATAAAEPLLLLQMQQQLLLLATAAAELWLLLLLQVQVQQVLLLLVPAAGQGALEDGAEDALHHATHLLQTGRLVLQPTEEEHFVEALQLLLGSPRDREGGVRVRVREGRVRVRVRDREGIGLEDGPLGLSSGCMD